MNLAHHVISTSWLHVDSQGPARCVGEMGVGGQVVGGSREEGKVPHASMSRASHRPSSLFAMIPEPNVFLRSFLLALPTVPLFGTCPPRRTPDAPFATCTCGTVSRAVAGGTDGAGRVFQNQSAEQTWIRIRTRRCEPPTVMPCWLHSQPGPGAVGLAGLFAEAPSRPCWELPGGSTSVISVQSTEGLASATSMGSFAVSVMQPTWG